MVPRIALLTGLLLLAAPLSADVINYQGRLKVDGTGFNGVGRFKFALVDARGAVGWSSGEMPLSVTDGRYAVRLGDSPQAPAIAAALLTGAVPAKLRIWFFRPGRDWVALTPDTVLAETPAVAAPATPTASNTEMLAELRAIRGLLSGAAQGQARAPAAPAPLPTVTVSIAGAPSLGSLSAPVVLVEFTDFQCPFCIKFQSEVFGRLKSAYVDTGKIRVVSRHVPLPFHQYAEPAARAAMCADSQGQFWPMRDKLFAAAGDLGADALTKLARDTGLDAAKFAQCTAAGEIAAAVAREIQEAKAAGIEATPTFVLGRATGDKVSGVKIVGAMPFENFDAEIKKLLAAKN